MHLCPGNVVAIGRAVMYFARAAHTFSAGIKCRHCSLRTGFTQEVVFWAVPCTHSTASPNDSRVNQVNMSEEVVNIFMRYTFEYLYNISQGTWLD